MSVPAVTPMVAHRFGLVMTGRCAVLSDIPEKWAETLELLKQNGVDPEGFEDFETGRELAIRFANQGVKS